MKILLISEYFPSGKDLKFSGGVEARNYYLAKKLAKKHKITVLASNLKGQKRKEKISGINVIRVGSTRKYNATIGSFRARIDFIQKSQQVSKGLEIELVEGTNFITHLIAKNISKSKQIPSVAWYPDVWVGSWINNSGIYGLFGEILERFNLIRGFDAYIAISKQTAKKLKKFTKQKISIIYCGVEKQNLVKKNINEIPKIICVSRFTKYKNIKTLIFAFANLSSKIEKIQLILVGTGPDINKLKTLCKDLNISTKVKFYSNLSRKDLVALYSTSDIFSLPSKVEGFGIATIEACSFGIPYVNSDILVQREITNNGQGGFLVDPNSPLDFSDKFYKLLGDKKIYNKKAKEAIDLARQYNWEKISQETEKVYKSLV